ncbi:MAG: Omp28-related outer membrane protein [Bacteroidota bacterium]
MHKLRLAILLSLALVIPGCDGDKDTIPDIESLLLSLSKNKIVADGIDYAKVTVKDQNGMDITASVTIYYNDEIITFNKIVTTTPSTSAVYASYENIESNEEVLEAVEDRNLKFKKNVLMEQYTGTWCGWCPRAIDQIHNLELADSSTIHVAYHLSDEFAYISNLSLFQSFGFTGIPTVHADRSEVWQGEVPVITAMHDPAPIGLSLEVTGTSSEINADVNVKFGYDFTHSLNISIFLLHDSLVAGQANYYDTDVTSVYYKAGNPMPGFIHKNVMLKPGTDMFGDVIPSASVDIGVIYNKQVTFSSFTCNDLKKMVVIAFIAASSGEKTGEVLNCIKAKVGQKIDFVYDED